MLPVALNLAKHLLREEENGPVSFGGKKLKLREENSLAFVHL